jgi:hypothetical protein
VLEWYNNKKKTWYCPCYWTKSKAYNDAKHGKHACDLDCKSGEEKLIGKPYGY